MSAEILRDLAHAKAVFQLRAIETIIRGPAIATEAQRAETPQSGSVHEGAGPTGIAQDIGGPSQ